MDGAILVPPPMPSWLVACVCIIQLQSMFYSPVLHSLSLLSLTGVTILHQKKKGLLNLKASNAKWSVNEIKTQTVSSCSHTGIIGLKLRQDTGVTHVFGTGDNRGLVLDRHPIHCISNTVTLSELILNQKKFKVPNLHQLNTSLLPTGIYCISEYHIQLFHNGQNFILQDCLHCDY